MVRKEVGSVWWEVCWTIDVPRDENGDSDFDAAEECERIFASKEEAKRFAESVYHEDYFGSVQLSRFRVEYLVPEHRAGRVREQIGETEYYSGPQEGWTR